MLPFARVPLYMYADTRGPLVYTWRLFHHPTVVKKGFSRKAYGWF